MKYSPPFHFLLPGAGSGGTSSRGRPRSRRGFWHLCSLQGLPHQGNSPEVALLLVAGQVGRVAGVRSGDFPQGVSLLKWRLYLPEQQNACGFLGSSSWQSLPSAGANRDTVGKNPCIAHAHQMQTRQPPMSGPRLCAPDQGQDKSWFQTQLCPWVSHLPSITCLLSEKTARASPTR